jgi:hypothetical protein
MSRSFRSGNTRLARPSLPVPRGPLTEYICDRLQGPPRTIHPGAIPGQVSLDDEDTQLALHVCYGLHYDGFVGVEEQWEWHPSLLALTARLEDRFLAALHVPAYPRARESAGGRSGQEVVDQVRDLLATESGPSLSAYLATAGSVDELREFVIHRSIYQRKEADPHTWAIPRLRGRTKSAMVTLQTDEYGSGIAGRSHAELFAITMMALDLDPAPGAYIDQVPGVALATDNLVSLFGLHRRWRGALVGHLAAFEMTSVIPMSRYATAMRRLVGGPRGAEFYDVHVEADVIHEKIAADDLIMGLAESDPDAVGDVLFGVSALLEVEHRFSSHLLDRWAANQSSLYALPDAGAVTEQSLLPVLWLEKVAFGRTTERPASMLGGAPPFDISSTDIDHVNPN